MVEPIQGINRKMSAFDRYALAMQQMEEQSALDSSVQSINIEPKLIKELQKKNIAIIFEDCMVLYVKISRDGRKLHLTFKQITEDQQNRFVKEKLATYDVYYDIFANSVRGIGEVAGAAAGNGKMIGALAGAGVKAVLITGGESLKSQKDNRYASAREHHDYHANQYGTSTRSFQDNLQQDEQGNREALNRWHSIDNSMFDLFRAVASQ